MARKINISQFKSKMRQIEQKQRRAINDYNRAVKQYNDKVNKAIRDYNSFVRSYNATVRRNRQIISHEIAKLQARTAVTTSYIASTNVMQQRYANVNRIYAPGVEVTPQQDRILDLIEQEHANGLITANTVENNELPEENTEDINIGNKLANVSEDLHNRWKGAVFSLSPLNPDAARHFCTSTREIFTEFIELKAPDKEVFAFNPDCEKTDRGNATRREKIKYMMRNKQMDDSVSAFVEADITNILELFHVLSNGTHGAAGKYEFSKLVQVKKRVEQGINFLCEIAA